MSSEYLSHALGVAAERLLELKLVKRIPVASPAAGAEFLQKVPGGVIWELLSVYWTFVTSATVANRIPQLVVQDADTNFLGRYANGNNIAASLTTRVTFGTGLGVGFGGVSYLSPLPEPPIALQSGDRIQSQTSAIDATDQLSGIVITVREWSETDVIQEMMEMDELLNSLTQREVTGR